MPRHIGLDHTLRRLRFTILFVILAGCAAPVRLPALPPLQAPELAAHIEGLLCRLSADCASFPVLLVDREEAQAELLPDGGLAIRLGLLLELRNDDELAFVLAHEMAHRELQHRPARSLKARLPLELAADAQAQARMRRRGMRADAGLALLSRLRASLPAASDGAAANQLDLRIAALASTSTQAPLTDLKIDEPLLRLLSPWRRPID